MPAINKVKAWTHKLVFMYKNSPAGDRPIGPVTNGRPGERKYWGKKGDKISGPLKNKEVWDNRAT